MAGVSAVVRIPEDVKRLAAELVLEWRSKRDSIDDLALAEGGDEFDRARESILWEEAIDDLIQTFELEPWRIL